MSRVPHTVRYMSGVPHTIRYAGTASPHTTHPSRQCGRQVLWVAAVRNSV